MGGNEYEKHKKKEALCIYGTYGICNRLRGLF